MSLSNTNLTKEIIDEAIGIGKLACHHLHPGMSCPQDVFIKCLRNLKWSAKAFIPIHLIPFLLFKRKDLKNHPKRALLHALHKYVNSILYMTSGCCILFGLQCFLTNYTNLSSAAINAIRPVFGSGLGSLFESESRRQELSLFVLPRVLDGIWLLLKHRKIVGDFPIGANLVFALAMGIISYYHHKKDGCIKHSFRALFKKFWGVN